MGFVIRAFLCTIIGAAIGAIAGALFWILLCALAGAIWAFGDDEL